MNAVTQLEPRRQKAVWGSRIRMAVVLGSALLVTSCSEVVRSGTGSSDLVLFSLQSASGASVVQSDVRTVDATGVQSVTNDNATATFQVLMKDQGSNLAPTPVNAITVTQYHVVYTRSDGRNREGVDVPFAFDGAVTQNIPAGGQGSVGFTLVRNQAKLEAPLAAMSQTNIPTTMIATITFYGKDGSGRESSVTGSIEVTFANFPG